MSIKLVEKLREEKGGVYGVNAFGTIDLAKVKEQQKRKLETDLRQNQFWMTNLYDAYYLGNNPADILLKQKQLESLTSKKLQDAAKKYINLASYIRVILKPEKDDKSLKPF
jgi:zinc protease